MIDRLINQFLYFIIYIQTLDFFQILLIVTNIFIAVIVLKALLMIWRLSKNKLLGLNNKAYNSIDQKNRRILILGDSTAVGTGANRPEDTIGGLLAHDYPDSQIINVATNGGLVADLKKQIKDIKTEKFDLIIVSTGGNDVWHYTRLKKIQNKLTEILPQIVSMSNGRVIFLVYNNIGSAPIFPKIIQWFLNRRCLLVHEVIRETARKSDVPIIDLFSKSTNNPFIESSPGELFASDGIHPSSAGYKLWYKRMWLEMTKRGYRY